MQISLSPRHSSCRLLPARAGAASWHQLSNLMAMKAESVPPMAPARPGQEDGHEFVVNPQAGATFEREEPQQAGDPDEDSCVVCFERMPGPGRLSHAATSISATSAQPNS